MNARILVIDDEPNVRAMIKLALQHVGHTVEVAGDGSLGLKAYADGSAYDLILLDQKMPGLQGVDIIQRIIRINPEAKIILITAHGTMDLALEAMHAGASDFLRKPFAAETLRNAVQAALTKERSTDAAIPLSLVCREFTRSTINGFSMDFDRELEDATSHERIFIFNVSAPSAKAVPVRILLPSYVLELVYAHADTERLPGGVRFWQALCEEALAEYLWESAQLPSAGQLRITDLTANLKHWIDSVITVSLAEENGR